MSDKVWYIHHGVLLEPLLEPLERRKTVVRENKDAAQRATRLLWMQRVLNPGAIPRAVVRSADDYSIGPYGVGDKLVKAILANRDALRRLHARELPLCPWDWNRMEMVFPGPTEDKVCVGYNPYKLRQSCVGAGWRLLLGDEIGLRKPRSEIEMWSNDGQRWLNGGFRGCDVGTTYRTTLPYPLPKE